MIVRVTGISKPICQFDVILSPVLRGTFVNYSYSFLSVSHRFCFTCSTRSVVIQTLNASIAVRSSQQSTTNSLFFIATMKRSFGSGKWSIGSEVDPYFGVALLYQRWCYRAGHRRHSCQCVCRVTSPCSFILSGSR